MSNVRLCSVRCTPIREDPVADEGPPSDVGFLILLIGVRGRMGWHIERRHGTSRRPGDPSLCCWLILSHIIEGGMGCNSGEVSVLRCRP